MYLSCYDLNLSAVGVRRALNDCYEMHKIVMSVFANKQSTSPRRDMEILYRIIKNNKKIKLYVSSNEVPIKEMPQGFEKVEGSPKDINGVLGMIKNGMSFCFDIMVMPSKKIVEKNNKNSKRVFILDSETREKWFKEKAVDNGFIVKSLFQDRIIDNKLKKKFGFQSVVYKGELVVTDYEKFKKAYTAGLGPQKSFGCGMLLLSKLQ